MQTERRPLPLASQPAFAFTCFEEVQALYSEHHYPVRLQLPAGQRKFAYRGHYASVGSVGLSAHEFAGPLSASSENAAEMVVLHRPIGGSCGATYIARQRYELVPGKSGVIVPHGIHGSVHWDGGVQSIGAAFRQSDLDEALTVLTGASPGAKVRFEPSLSLSHPTTAAFFRLLDYVIAEVDHGGLAPQAMDRLGELLMAQLLHAQPHVHSTLVCAPAQPDEPARVRRVAEYLEANANRSVSMSELVRVTGTSARNVQAGFKKHRGCSPMTFLRARRLEKARLLLLAEDRPVTEIAADCGFLHPGRFSLHYRAHFGETPTETRRRPRRR